MSAKVGGVLIDVAADISKLVNGMNKAQQVADKKTKMIKKSLGLITTAVAAVGGTASIKALLDNADAIGEQAEALGLASESWSKYIYISKFAGVEVGTLSAAFGAMTRRTNNFVRTGGGAAKTAMQELGITTEFARKNFTTADKTFEIIIGKLSQLEDGTRKTAIAQDIFSKSASQVVRYANLGATEIQRLGNEAQRTGNIISTEFASDAGEVNEALDVLGTTFTGIGNKVLIEFTPAILTATRALEDFLGVQRKQSAFEIKREIIELEKEIKKLNKLAQTQPLLAADHYATASTKSTHLSKAKREYQEIITYENKKTEVLNANKIAAEKALLERIKKMRAVADAKNKKSKEKKTEFYGPDDSDYIKAYEEFTAKKKSISSEFETQFKTTTMNRYNYERELLEKKKTEYLYYGENKLEVDKWYSEQSKEISALESKQFEQDMQKKREASNNWVYGMEDALKEYEDKSKDTYQVSKNFFTNSIDEMSLAVANFATGSKDSFSDMAKSIIKDMIRIQVQKQATGLLGNLFSFVGSKFSGNSNSWTTGSHVSSGAMKYANGGHLKGGSGVRDDLYLGNATGNNIYAMGGEYIVNKSSVNSVGLGTMDYINKTGQLPFVSSSTEGNIQFNLNIENNSGSDISAEQVSSMSKKNHRGELVHTIGLVMEGARLDVLGFGKMMKGNK